jgi:hypothetical protein
VYAGIRTAQLDIAVVVPGQPTLPIEPLPAKCSQCQEEGERLLNAHSGPPGLLTPAITSRALRTLVLTLGIARLRPA